MTSAALICVRTLRTGSMRLDKQSPLSQLDMAVVTAASSNMSSHGRSSGSRSSGSR